MKVMENGVNTMHLNYLLAFDHVIASRGGIPLIEEGKIIGAIGCSGGTDSQDEVVSKAGVAAIWAIATVKFTNNDRRNYVLRWLTYETTKDGQSCGCPQHDIC